MRQVLPSHAGTTVMLPQTIFEYDAIFERYGIKQKFVNPEETNYHRFDYELSYLATAETKDGVNIFFKNDLMPLPESTLIFTDEAASPWLRMSEGLMPVDAVARDYTIKTEWRTYADKVKFYMSLDKEPTEDWELTLKGAVFDDRWDTTLKLEVKIFVNNHEIGAWQIDKNISTAMFTIPKALLEESFRDETRLVTLMLRLLGVASFLENDREVSAYGLQLEEMRICPSAESDSK
jgi:hypothetical protein